MAAKEGAMSKLLELYRHKRMTGLAWQMVRECVLARDGHRCVACGSSGPLEVDHIVPLAFGGGHAHHNLRTLCRPCHQARTRQVFTPAR